MLSIVIPIYNEKEVLDAFYLRIKSVLDGIPDKTELIFVNDGSDDTTLDKLLEYQKNDTSLVIIDLSRNFGKEAALTAGIDHSSGEAVIVIDADLQDPPELIPKLIEKWREGYDMVYARRVSREGESSIKKITSKSFYRILTRLSKVAIPEDTGDFRILSRRAVESLNLLRERNRFMKGLFAWIGYPQAEITYNRDPRYAGTTKWNYLQLWNLAIEGFTSFTVAPLKIATYLGLITAIVAFFFGAWILLRTLLYGDPVAGFPTMIVVILFLGGVQLLTIGIMGEYLGRIFTESKQRPIYLVHKLHRNTDIEQA